MTCDCSVISKLRSRVTKPPWSSRMISGSDTPEVKKTFEYVTSPVTICGWSPVTGGRDGTAPVAVGAGVALPPGVGLALPAGVAVGLGVALVHAASAKRRPTRMGDDVRLSTGEW